ncbi:MAG: protein kinase [Bradymonadaceae bacterium]|nr:protein kinase [Lujinxingiaceae bacterium]
MLLANLPNLKQGDLVAGRFRIVETIGSGGFSVVYRAHQEGMNRFVALKVLKPKASADEQIVERFRREALYASHLSHPNTITLFDFGQTDDGLCYIAMEYLVGMDLSVVVQKGEPLDLARVWKILAQTCRSLSEAHRIGIVHRDLKPENIFLVQRDGIESIKVLDFGVSKAITDFTQAGPRTLAPLTMEGTVFGTPLYMAPEQAMAEPITPAVDVYALGHIGYEMITGRAAYDDSTSAMDVMLRQINDPPLELPDPWKRTPFAALIHACTQKDPRARYADAALMLERLQDDAFIPYMDPSEQPASMRTLPQTSAVVVPSGEPDTIEIADEAEEIYRWEFGQLEEALSEVRKSGEMRLVVIRGRPGTGRSNLVRAFLKKHRTDRGLCTIHRNSNPAVRAMDVGLEADLADVIQRPLRGNGMSEVHRLLALIYGEEVNAVSEEAFAVSDASPLSHLTALRENVLARVGHLFRRAAEPGAMIWGVESLEQVDTLTLAFLDRFFRELQANPAPVLLIATVHPDDLLSRPGSYRYTQALLQASRPLSRQLQLIESGTRSPEGEGLDAPFGLALDGSFAGVEVPSFDVPAAEPASFADDGQRTDRMLAVSAQLLALDQSQADIDLAFDTVLGYLAQLGDVVSLDLWHLACHELLPSPHAARAVAIIGHAERFGIVVRNNNTLAFTNSGYTESMREGFERLSNPRSAHRQIVNFLRECWPQPNHEQVRLLVHHALAGDAVALAKTLLVRAGDVAFAQMNLDASREYFLQLKGLLDDPRGISAMSTHTPSPYARSGDDDAADGIDRPRVWLRLGEIHGALGEHGAAEEALRQAMREAPEDAHRIRGAVFKLLADLAVSQNRFHDAMGFYEKACEVFRKLGLARAYVACVAEIGRCAILLGRARRAEGILLQAMDKAKKIQDPVIIARIDRYMGQVLTRQARFLEAVEHLQRAMTQFEGLGREADAVICLDELGIANFAAGHYVPAREDFTRALALCSTHHVGSPHAPHVGLARALAALGNLPQAEAHLVEALAVCGMRNEPIRMAEVQYLLGDLYIATQRSQLAGEYFDHVFQLARSVGHIKLAFDSLVRQAYAAFDSNDEELTYDKLSEAAHYAEEVKYADGVHVARAHIIFLQLLDHGFQARGDTFSTLLTVTDDGQATIATVLCDLFRVDVACARGSFEEAHALLGKVRILAANVGDYALFIPIARRDYLIAQTQGRLADPHAGQGVALGASIPPEVGKRRFSESRMAIVTA